MYQQRSQRDKWRIGMVLSVANLFVIKARVILGAGMPQRVMIRMISLNQDVTGTVTTPRAAGHLSNQLKRSFGRAKVRQLQTRINRDDADQRHVGKIVALREHLGP